MKNILCILSLSKTREVLYAASKGTPVIFPDRVATMRFARLSMHRASLSKNLSSENLDNAMWISEFPLVIRAYSILTAAAQGFDDLFWRTKVFFWRKTYRSGMCVCVFVCALRATDNWNLCAGKRQPEVSFRREYVELSQHFSVAILPRTHNRDTLDDPPRTYRWKQYFSGDKCEINRETLRSDNFVVVHERTRYRVTLIASIKKNAVLIIVNSIWNSRSFVRSITRLNHAEIVCPTT